MTARTAAKRTRIRVLRAAGLAGLLALATACTGDTPSAPTAVVDRGTVSNGVSASGSLVSITQQNLGFADRGQIAELFVKVGDAVQAGQPLARLDAAAARSQLASAQAKLDQQRASLGKLTGGNSVEAAQAALDSARKILDATRGQVAATDAADASAVDRAKVQLDFDKKQLELAERQLQKDRKACAASMAAPSASSKKTLLGLGGAEGTPDSSTANSAASPPAATPQQDAATSTDPSCTAIPTDQQAVQTAKGAVIQSQTALDAAEHQRDTDRASGRVSVANAESTASDARSQLDSAGNDAPADVDVQDAVVRDAENAVADAQQAVDNTVLRAPVAGTVSAITGAVGDFVAAAGGAAPLAPGTDARIPAAVGMGDAAATSDSGGAFITLNDLQTFQLVVPFEESDAAKVRPNQRVDVTVDAVPGLTSPGTVVAVAPTADQISGVVSYYATIVLTQVDPQLKDGQTAQADVLTEVADDVLRVPAAAVRQENGRSVSVPGPDGQPATREFTPGLVGDSFTEVRSGLDEGQQVLLPQATVEASANGGGNGRRGG
ncbi:HlyD family efflux transporter periplasmic adaptor subunit [Pseudonocardia sp. RS11V-5]|uniref:HlyD family efflux transporter periplasmic adaptor subunit n=1 Tax=Pseudonocardia terrae TaxID=2905831 RepID=UPI001E367295|nr:HlyD family efflux transporter periplasmic adaptor subunit [Pseudonocardia terrae]MCE3556186.1 HlyD family efflux transporter periplasmic adaptor subunit [Pseudonocardia terrae]